MCVSAFCFSKDSDYKSRHTKKSQYKIEDKVRKTMDEVLLKRYGTFRSDYHHDFSSTLDKKSFLEKEDE